MLRVFVAVGLPQEVKAGLSVMRRDLNTAGGEAVRWVSEDGIHLTLKFLGEIPEGMVVSVSGALEHAVEGVKPFGLEISESGFFPSAKRPKVFWVGLKGDLDSLLVLHNKVDKAMGSLGFQCEEREFSPHLTLARFREKATDEQKRAFVEHVTRSKLMRFAPIRVDGISLMKSVLNPAGSIYSELARFRLEE